MKIRIQTFFAVTFTLLLGAFAATPLHADDGKPIAPEALPAAAQTFVKENFPSQKIVLAMHDKGWISSKYEVTLANGTEIEFDGKGEWREIEAKSRRALPDSVIPAAILAHIKEHHKDSPAKEIAKKRYGYKIELRNGLELKFNKDGKFIGYDD